MPHQTILKPSLETPPANPPPAVPALEDRYADRLRHLWERAEALTASWLLEYWQPPEEEANSPGGGRECCRPSSPSSPSGPQKSDCDYDYEHEHDYESKIPGGALYPPGVSPPLRSAPAPRDLSATIINLRRIQDARLALERGIPGGGDSDDASGNGIDLAALRSAVSRVLGGSAAPAAQALDEDAMRD